MSKAPNPNIQETTLHLSVFYDTTKTNPDEVAKRFNNLLHSQLTANHDALAEAIGDTHVNNMHCPVAEVVEPVGNQSTRAAYNASTIDEALDALTKAKEASHLGGAACVYVSLTDSEIELLPVDAFAIVNDATGGAILEVRAKLPEGLFADPLGMDSIERQDQAEQIRKFTPPEETGDIELADGGCLEAPDASGTIRRRDKDGNCEEVRDEGDAGYEQWRALFPLNIKREEEPGGG